MRRTPHNGRETTSFFSREGAAIYFRRADIPTASPSVGFPLPVSRRSFLDLPRSFAPVGGAQPQKQEGNLKEPIRVLQLKVPSAFRYSVVYQKVQLSTGSIAMLL